jgi:threonine aldolase
MHMDGARLWEAREAYAPRAHAEICAHFDSVYVSFYKGIGALAGAALAGSKAFVDEARLWRKRMGGTLVQLHPYVASAAMRFDAQLARMAARRDAAITLGRSLARADGIRVLPDPPQVAMFHLHFEAPPEAMLAARNAIAESDGTWVPGGFVAGATPGTSYVEVNVGDATAALDPARVTQAYAKVVARALAA